MEAILLLLEIIFIAMAMRDICRAENSKDKRSAPFFEFK